jgi:hypothetical protein
VVSPLSPRRLVEESLPIAAVLLVWTVASWLVPVEGVSGPVRDAGVVMAGLYAVVRGLALSDEVTAPVSVPADVASTLRLNVPAILAAGPWFLAGGLVHVGGSIYRLLPVVGGLYTSPAAPLARVCAGTGLAVVLVYAVAVGLPAGRAALSTDADADADTDADTDTDAGAGDRDPRAGDPGTSDGPESRSSSDGD